MIKKILKFLGIILLVAFVILNTYMIVTLSYNTSILLEGLQEQISQLQKDNNQSVRNDIQLSGNFQDLQRDLNKSKIEMNSLINELSKNNQNIKSDLEDAKIEQDDFRYCTLEFMIKTIENLKELDDKTLEIDRNLIINGSVFVQSLMGSGSGTVIKKTEDAMYILTCYHVIETNWKLKQNGFNAVPTIGYSRDDMSDKLAGLILYGAEIIKIDEENDLALLKTSYNDKDLNEIKLAEIPPEKGDIVFSVGHPLGMLNRVLSKGILSSKVEGFFISDNTSTFGNSGGGLFNIKGELIGVPAQVLGYSAGKEENGGLSFIPESSLGMSINLTRIKEFLKDTEVSKSWVDVVADGATEILKELKKIK